VCVCVLCVYKGVYKCVSLVSTCMCDVACSLSLCLNHSSACVMCVCDGYAMAI